MVKGDDKDAITKKSEELATASGNLAERAYKKASAKAEAGAGAEGEGAQSGKKDDVVDAEFSEVKDEDKKG